MGRPTVGLPFHRGAGADRSPAEDERVQQRKDHLRAARGSRGEEKGWDHPQSNARHELKGRQQDNLGEIRLKHNFISGSLWKRWVGAGGKWRGAESSERRCLAWLGASFKERENSASHCSWGGKAGDQGENFACGTTFRRKVPLEKFSCYKLQIVMV